jgi:hypothetical protein
LSRKRSTSGSEALTAPDFDSVSHGHLLHTRQQGGQ